MASLSALADVSDSGKQEFTIWAEISATVSDIDHKLIVLPHNEYQALTETSAIWDCITWPQWFDMKYIIRLWKFLFKWFNRMLTGEP